MADIEELKKEALATGQVKRTVVTKRPEGPSIPEVAKLLPEPFVLEVAPMEAILVGDLRELCEKNPKHPLAAAKLLSVALYHETQTVYCLRQDLETLRNDKNGLIIPASARQ